jgi:formate C-acetyltransferase
MENFGQLTDRMRSFREDLLNAEKVALRKIAPFWEHNTVKDRGLAAMSASARVFYDLGIIKAEGNITSGDAHVSVNYRRMLAAGLREYKERSEQKLAALDLTDYRNLEKAHQPHPGVF